MKNYQTELRIIDAYKTVVLDGALVERAKQQASPHEDAAEYLFNVACAAMLVHVFAHLGLTHDVAVAAVRDSHNEVALRGME